MSRFLQRIRFLSQLVLSLCICSVQAQDDPVLRIVGEWNVAGTATSILIQSDHIVHHSKWGRGDIKWDNAYYYTISYRERSIVCHYFISYYPKTDEIAAATTENTDPQGCELGNLRRATSHDLTALRDSPEIRKVPETGSILNKVSSFLDRYHSEMAVDVNLTEKYLAPYVNFYKKGLVSKEYIVKEKMEVSVVCPVRRYFVLRETITAEPISNTTYDVTFKVRSTCQSSKRDVTTMWFSHVVIDFANDPPQIKSIDGSKAD
jgi:hypothetical protein